MLRVCGQCGKAFNATHPGAKRCPQHAGGAGWSNRDRSFQNRFRNAVLQNAGWRCEADDIATGGRCTRNATDAHHLRPLSEGGGYNPEYGMALCGHHHHELDPHAR